MDATLKARWIAALRSGEYRQGRRLLRASDGSYCCLGVLCEVAGLRRDGEMFVFPGALGTSADPSRHKAMIFGSLRAAVTDFTEPADRAKELIEMNDCGHTFAEIANWIDDHIPAEWAE